MPRLIATDDPMPADPMRRLPSEYSAREEQWHQLTHGAGAVASLAAIPWLAQAALAAGDRWLLAGGLAFGLSALAMFATSVAYHASRDPARRLLLRRFDHSAIYLLIPGTYTPFMLGPLRGAWGYSLFALIWALAVLGIVFKTTRLGFRFHRSSVALYVLMGWLAVVATRPLLEALTPAGFGWLVAGGLAYTLGVPFYLWKTRRYAHAVWHAFVLAGVACHFFAVLGLMAPRAAG